MTNSASGIAKQEPRMFDAAASSCVDSRYLGIAPIENPEHDRLETTPR